MLHRIVCVVLLSLLIVPSAWGDITMPGVTPDPNRRRTLPPLPPVDSPKDDGKPKQLPRLLIVHDPNEPTTRLVLPANATAARKTEEVRTVRTAAFPFVGVALAGSLIGGGLWLARVPKAQYLLAAVLPLGAIALAGFAAAQPARPEPGRTVIETMKVRISRASIGSDYHLILPKR
jgi:hypothetical protein